MNRIEQQTPLNPFRSLDPDTVLTLVEKALGRQCTNLCRPLASYINRVFEVEDEQGYGLVVKFYRPGRWSKAALQDEHDFLLELEGQEIPVVAPLQQQDGSILGDHEGMYFAVFPKKGGRSFDEFDEEQWLELGRLIGRVHAVGARRLPQERITMAPHRSTREQLDYLLAGPFLEPDLKVAFQAVTESLISETSPLFESCRQIRIHGDCHFANLIYRPGESFYIIDFDDMAVGPPVQDFWMLLPGYAKDCPVEIDFFLEGYETFFDFDRTSLLLVEPLRAMRYIHYISWCAHQVAEDGMSHVAPDFGTRHYWQQEIADLMEQLERIRSMPKQWGGNY